MQNNNQNSKTDQGLNLVDLMVYLASKWKWFVLSVLICGGIAWYKYATAPEVYFRSATVIIKDPSNKTATAGLDRFDNLINKVNISNEILQFRSKLLMREVVQRLRVDVSYEMKTGLRMTDLYTKSPVIVTFDNVLPNRYISMDVTPKTDNTVVLSDIKGLPGAKGTYELKMNDTLTVGDEHIIVTPSEHYGNRWFGKVIKVAKNPVNAVAGNLLGNLGIRQEVDAASLITLSLKAGNPQLAEDVLNTLISIYNEEAINEKNQAAINTSNFINERLIIIEKELGGVESEIERFKQVNEMPTGIGATASRYEGESQSYNAEALQQETQLRLAEFIKEYLIDPSKIRDLIPSGTGIADPSVESQIAQYNSLKLKRDKLIADSSESNPVVEEMTRTIESLRQSIIRAVDNMIVSINMKRNDARARQYQAQARVSTIPTKEREMLSIERQHKIKESLYLFLLNKREENALSQAMADNNARIIDSVDGPGGPISPQRNRIMLLGILIGIAIPAVFFLLLLFMDTRVHSRKDFKGLVSIPFLGEVPQDKDVAKRSHHDDIVVTPDEHGMLSESFRMLRSNIAFMAKKDQKQQVLMLTSFNEGAGKTFIARNLAMSLVFAKKRVVILDLDIRKGSLSRHFKRHPLGVTNYLSDPSVTIDEVIHTDDNYPGLDIISAGTIAPNPAELLLDGRLDEMIAALRERYDYIIADSVPVGMVADARITNRISDLTIFVVRAGKLDRRQIPDMEELYRDEKLKHMSYVLNGVDPRYHGYGSRYGYGYGYGYGY